MVYFEVAGFSMLVVNSHDVAVDLFCKRSSVYSSRPQFIMPSLWVSVRFRKIFANFVYRTERVGIGQLLYLHTERGFESIERSYINSSYHQTS